MKYRIRYAIADTMAILFICAIAAALPTILFAWAGV